MKNKEALLKCRKLIKGTEYKTVTQFAKKVGIVTSTFYNIFDPKVNVSDHIVEAVAELLGMDIDEFYEKMGLDSTLGKDVTYQDGKVDLFQKQESSISDKIIQDLNDLKKYLEAKCQNYIVRELKAVSTNSEESETWTAGKILESNLNFTIIGEPGIGKTTFLDVIALEAIKREVIPIYVDLRYPFRLEAFKDLVISQSKSYKDSLMGVPLTEAEFGQRKFIFCFDHLDQSQINALGAINSFIDERKNNQRDSFIICCRTNDDEYYRAIRSSNVIQLQELGIDDIREVLKDQDIEKLHPVEETNEHLIVLSKNPYRLELLIDISKNRPEMGKELEIVREVDIYDQFIGLHLGREAKRRKVAKLGNIPYPFDLKRYMLASLAFKIQNSDSAGLINRLEAEDFLVRELPRILTLHYGLNQSVDLKQIQKIVREIEDDGVIVLSIDETKYFFIHDLLQDYFCAFYLSNSLERTEALRYLDDEFNNSGTRWKNIFVFYSGLVEDATELVEKIFIRATLNSVRKIGYNLAAQCIRDAKYIDSEASEELTYSIVMNYLYEEQFPDVDNILLLNSFFVKRMLLNEIRSANIDVWSRVLVAFLNMDVSFDEVGEVLKYLIINDIFPEAQHIRINAVTILGKTRSIKAITTIIKCLEDKYGRIRYHAVFALSEFDDEQVIQPLVRRSLEDEEADVRNAANEILKTKFPDKSKMLFLRHAESDKNEYRKRSIEALSIIQGKASQDFLIQKLEIERAPDVVAVIAFYLGFFACEDGFDPLLRLLFKCDESEVRLRLVWAMTKIDYSRTLRVLLQKLTEKSNDMKMKAILALGDSGMQEALPALMDVANSMNQEFKDASLNSIYSIKENPFPRHIIADPTISLKQFFSF